MHDLRSIQIPKIENSTVFEELCCDLWKKDQRYENVCLNGRKGQTQNGVDVFGRCTDSGTWFGIQCKVRKNRLTKKEMLSEISMAKNFNPKISKFIICTTFERDSVMQKYEREIKETSSDLTFEFSVLYWNDIVKMLKKETNLNIYMKYYQNHFVDNTALGHSIGKLMNLELGEWDHLDTRYEIMIGKIPKIKDCDYDRVDYYRNTYFIVNWHQRSIETFPIPCHPSDLERAFSSPYDRARVSEWLNSIEDIDKLIFDDVSNAEYRVSFEWKVKHIREQKGD